MLRSVTLLSSLILAAGTLAAAAVLPIVQDMKVLPPMAEHKMLLESAGDWEGSVVHIAPDKTESTAQARERIEPIGPYWTQSRFESDFMGSPYLGTGVMGYDPEKKKFIGTWVDNMSSYFALMEGKMEGDKLVMRWQAPDLTSGKLVPHRSETTHAADTVTTTFFVGDGAGTKNMVITMKRKGGKPVEAGGKLK